MKVRVGFRNMWHGITTPEKFFAGMPYMLDAFDFELSEDPDFVFTSVYKRSRPGMVNSSKIVKNKRRRVRIGFLFEKVRPDFLNYDWVFSNDYEDEFRHPRQFRLPFYIFMGAGKDLIKRNDIPKQKKTKFCAFVYSHKAPHRDQLFRMLSKYKRVDAPGQSFNNMAPIGNVKSSKESRGKITYFRDVQEFLRPYKFVIAYENSGNYRGYTTEKLYNAMLVDSVPIYFGNPAIYRDFNPKSFINYYSFRSHAAVVRAIIKLDQNPRLYEKKRKIPWFYKNRLSPHVQPKAIISKFRTIFTKRVPTK